MVVVKRKPIEPTNLEHPFCEMMKQRREERGISLKSLSDMIGSGSRSYLSHIEKGRYAVSVELGLAICQVLDIPIHLCIDYISEVEIKRIRENIQNSYVEWLTYVPHNVLDTMLQDEHSLELHQMLSNIK